MEPIPIGTVVDYHGSHTHGRYVVTDHYTVTPELFSQSEMRIMEENSVKLDESYPDGVMYVIWRQGVLRKFGNRMYMIARVRRQSLTVTDEPPEVV